MPKVSVIIPTYNRAEFLKSAIESVLGQTYMDFELLISDDASTDNTEQVVESFSDKRIRFTKNEINKGVIHIRNKAVTNSTGEYIAFLDDDDEWMPEKLEKQINIIEGRPHSLGAVYTGAHSIDTKLGKVVKITTPKYRGNILKELLENNIIITSSIVVKKRCFEKVGLFDPEYRSASDFDMWIRLAEEYDFNYVKDSLVRYHIHPNSISTNYVAVRDGLERLLAKHNKLFSANNKAYSNHLLKLGVAYCYSGNTKRGKRAFIKAIELNPKDMRLYYNLLISMLGPERYRALKEARDSYFAHRSQNYYNSES